ncbi:hypothetical protein SAMN04515647_3695 [Cohaesibacter sp. ES.047]|nr:hypothetical protein SAMN04515647_3695 [Cohaesibacter sp. ES.047]
MSKVDRHFVEHELEDHRNTFCSSCGNSLTEEDDHRGDGFCWRCNDYFSSVYLDPIDDWSALECEVLP